jgi:hypothetical protein
MKSRFEGPKRLYLISKASEATDAAPVFKGFGNTGDSRFPNIQLSGDFTAKDNRVTRSRTFAVCLSDVRTTASVAQF